MLRQSSSRNHRSKGLKLKKALQISLLVVVSVWLIYQVKHSYEKKAAYNENDADDLHKDDQSQGDLDLKMFAAKCLAGRVRDAPESAMDDCIRRLEEEKGKIEVFRRELPLNMLH